MSTAVDFNDVPGEPQMNLEYSQPDAAAGYFVYRSFNTGSSDLGMSDFNLRVFWDGPTGNQHASGYSNVCQWDNLAITPASAFAPPTLVPEPAAAAAVGLLAMLGRRRVTC